jgi:hypothetical protein
METLTSPNPFPINITNEILPTLRSPLNSCGPGDVESDAYLFAASSTIDYWANAYIGLAADGMTPQTVSNPSSVEPGSFYATAPGGLVYQAPASTGAPNMQGTGATFGRGYGHEDLIWPSPAAGTWAETPINATSGGWGAMCPLG